MNPFSYQSLDMTFAVTNIISFRKETVRIENN